MADSPLQSPIATMRATVQAIESKLRHGNLQAASSSEPEGVLLRFRLRRAAEICRNVIADLDAGTLGAHQREMLELRNVSQALIGRLDAAIRGAN
jgi:hypothetical protein